MRMIEKYNLEKVLLVVTRYFGGTKLGTGGLIRAYGESAEETIMQAKIAKIENFEYLKVRYGFDLINKIQYVAKNFDAMVKDDADSNGMISTIRVLPSKLNAMQAELITQTAGKIVIV